MFLSYRKNLISTIISLSTCLLSSSFLTAQPHPPQSTPVSNFGYIEKGDSVEFVFGQERTIRIGVMEILLEKRIKEIKQVNLAGDFNGWNPNSSLYQMNKTAGGLFKITIRKASLGKPGETRQFKFVLNHQYWVEPPAAAPNKYTGTDGNTNLVLKL